MADYHYGSELSFWVLRHDGGGLFGRLYIQIKDGIFCIGCVFYLFFIMQSSGTYQAGLALLDAENTQLDARK